MKNYNKTFFLDHISILNEVFPQFYSLSTLTEDEKEALKDSFEEYIHLYRNSYVLGASRYSYVNMRDSINYKGDYYKDIIEWFKDLKIHINKKTPIYPLLDVLRHSNIEVCRGFYLFLIENLDEIIQVISLFLWRSTRWTKTTRNKKTASYFALKKAFVYLLNKYNTITLEDKFEFISLYDLEETLIYKEDLIHQEQVKEKLKEVVSYTEDIINEGKGFEKIELLSQRPACFLMPLTTC